MINSKKFQKTKNNMRNKEKIIINNLNKDCNQPKKDINN